MDGDQIRTHSSAVLEGFGPGTVSWLGLVTIITVGSPTSWASVARGEGSGLGRRSYTRNCDQIGKMVIARSVCNERYSSSIFYYTFVNRNWEYFVLTHENFWESFFTGNVNEKLSLVAVYRLKVVLWRAILCYTIVYKGKHPLYLCVSIRLHMPNKANFPFYGY